MYRAPGPAISYWCKTYWNKSYSNGWRLNLGIHIHPWIVILNHRQLVNHQNAPKKVADHKIKSVQTPIGTSPVCGTCGHIGQGLRSGWMVALKWWFLLTIPCHFGIQFWATLTAKFVKKRWGTFKFSVCTSIFQGCPEIIYRNMARPLIFLLEMVNVAVLVYQVATEDLDIWMDHGWTKSWTTNRMVKTCKPLITGAGFRNHPQYPKKVPDIPFWFPASWPLPELHGLTMRFAIQETKPCGKKQPNNKPFGVASTS